jgi:hypothetical protein
MSTQLHLETSESWIFSSETGIQVPALFAVGKAPNRNKPTLAANPLTVQGAPE